MFGKIIEGQKFKSRLTGVIFQVKKILNYFVVLEEVKNERHQLFTEIGTVMSFYEKVNDSKIPALREE